jgi:hypothetical protein
MNRCSSPRLALLASILVVAMAFAVGCSDDAQLEARFSPSATAAAPGLVKLVERSHSGTHVVVDAILFGPKPDLDLMAFQFGVKISNTDVVSFVPQSSYTQTALVAGAGQAIAVEVDGASDPSLVQVRVEKDGGGAGNGVAGTSAIVIELAFEVHASGSTTLTLSGIGGNPPKAIDSHIAPIGAVTFDAASANVMGVTTGGGGY